MSSSGGDAARGLVLAGLVAGALLLVAAPADAATPGGRSARPAAPAVAAPAPARPPRVSPYAVYARQRGQAASGAAHPPAVPPSMRRSAIGRHVPP